MRTTAPRSVNDVGGRSCLPTRGRTIKPPPPTPPLLRLRLRPHCLSVAAPPPSAAAASSVSLAGAPPSKPPLISFPAGAASKLRSQLRRLLGAAAQEEPPPWRESGDGSLLLVSTEYEFSRSQERAFVELDSAMTRCAARYLLLAVACAAAAAVGGGGGSSSSSHHHGSSLPCPHTWVARAEAAQALAVSVFLWAAGEPFARIAETRGSDLSHLMTGLSETAHALFEASIMSCGLCLLFAACAAALWPRGAFPLIAAMTFTATAARATLHRHPYALPPLLEAPGTAMKVLTSPLRALNRRRRAQRLKAMMRREKEKEKREEGGSRMVRRSGSSLSSGSSFPPPLTEEAGEATPDSQHKEYEFSTAQEQKFRLLVRSLLVLCCSRVAHAACEALVAVAAAATGDAVGAVAAGVGALEVAATAKLFWSASSSFDAVISSSGNDIKLLLAGVASAPGSSGLAAMFEKLCHVLELALFLKVAPLAVVGAAGLLSSFAPAELLLGGGGSLRGAVGALREFAAGVGVA